MPSFLRNPLAKEIALALVIKALAIALIFHLFFSDQSIQPDAASVAEHLTRSGPPGQP